MKKTSITIILLLFVFSAFSQVDKIVGKWKTIDDADGSTKSIVLIFKATNGKYYGKIEHLFKDPEKKCTECVGALKNKPIIHMVVINNMVEKDGALTGGTILDPNNGKFYKCNISYDNETGKLNVRCSLDRMGIIGRNQTWIRNS